MLKSCAHLFVYGTLMSSASTGMGTTERDRLDRAGKRLGTASVPGRLLDLGRYPGAIVDRGAATRVHGEVIWLEAPAAVFEWLDVYEGIWPEPMPGQEYRRTVERIEMANSAPLDAWIYLYIGCTNGLPVLASGRWHGSAG